MLAQLGAGKPASERPHFDECVSIAAAHLWDGDPLVAHSAAWALAHLQGDSATEVLLTASKCADAHIRLAVAYGLAGTERSEAIEALIRLTTDEDDEVRNWATFGLGNAGGEEGPPVRLGTLDSAAIRDALRYRMTDSFCEVRNEAIWGLARRRDIDALRLLLDRLSGEEWVHGD